MNHAERTSLYEKLYFNELDRRDKISARLALPFAVIVATVGLLSYLFHAPEKPSMAAWNYAFWTLYLAAAAALLSGAWFFRKAWFGHTDRLLPTAGHMEEYHRKLIDTYAGYGNADELVDTYFKGFLFNYYVECSSDNAINNDRRSFDIFRATASLTISVLLAFAAVVPLFAGTHFDRGYNYDATATAPTAAATAADAKCEGGHAETARATAADSAAE
jgi:hypothetical protein